jgi:hypothetical protein
MLCGSGGEIMDVDQCLRALKLVLWLTGFAFAIGVPVLTRLWPEAWMCEPRQYEYEQMMVGVYVTLGIFVLLAARNLRLRRVRRLSE